MNRGSRSDRPHRQAICRPRQARGDLLLPHPHDSARRKAAGDWDEAKTGTLLNRRDQAAFPCGMGATGPAVKSHIVLEHAYVSRPGRTPAPDLLKNPSPFGKAPQLRRDSGFDFALKSGACTGEKQ
jgi:hypothetical protein